MITWMYRKVSMNMSTSLQDTVFIGKHQKSRSRAKSASEKLALDTPLRRLENQNFGSRCPMNTQDKSPNFRTVAQAVFCADQKNYRGAVFPPLPLKVYHHYAADASASTGRFIGQ